MSLEKDQNIDLLIQKYKDNPFFYKKIGYSSVDHSRGETGCFYTEAIRETTNADVVIQNNGGIRSNLKKGIITPFDIYSIDPFGNGVDSFLITPAELNFFLKKYNKRYSISSGINVGLKLNGDIEFYRDGEKVGDDQKISLAMNDYISNTYGEYLPEPSYSYPFTTAEYIIKYLNNHAGGILNFENCNRY